MNFLCTGHNAKNNFVLSAVETIYCMFDNIILIFLYCLALKWPAHPNRIGFITKYARVHIWFVFCARCWFWSDCRENLLARIDLLHSGCFPGFKHNLSEKRNQGGSRGAPPPPKTYESNFFHHDFVQFGKQHSRYKAILL